MQKLHHTHWFVFEQTWHLPHLTVTHQNIDNTNYVWIGFE
jgi:hypothetical protein